MTAATAARVGERRPSSAEEPAHAQLSEAPASEVRQEGPRRDARPGPPAVHLSSAVQAKLTLGSTGDRYEREADNVADRVSAGQPVGSISRIGPGGLGAQRQADDGPAEAPPNEEEPTAQRKCAPCESEEKLQRIPDSDQPSRETDPSPPPAATPSATEAQAKCDSCGPAEVESHDAPSGEEVQRAPEDAAAGDGVEETPDETPADEEPEDVPEEGAQASDRLDDPADPDCGEEPDKQGGLPAQDEEEDAKPASIKADDLGCGEGGGEGGGGEGGGGEEAPEPAGEAEGGEKKGCGAASPGGGDAGGEEGGLEEDADAAAGDSRSSPAAGSAPRCSDEVDADQETPAAQPGAAPAGPEAAPSGESAPQGPCHPAVQRSAEDQAQAKCDGCAAEDALQREEGEGNDPEEDAESSAAAEARASEDTPEEAPRRQEPRGELKTEVAAEHMRARGPGEPLPPTVRRRLEASMGVDLDPIRVHADGRAQAASKALRAKAFTHRNQIFLGAGHSPHDVGLMAHESTHVLQQNAIERRPPPAASAPVADAMRGPRPQTPPAPGPVLGEEAQPPPAATKDKAPPAQPAAFDRPRGPARLETATPVRATRDESRAHPAPVDHSKASDTPEEAVRERPKEPVPPPRRPGPTKAVAAPATRPPGPAPEAEPKTPDKHEKPLAATGETPSASAPAGEEAATPDVAKTSPESDARFQGVVGRLDAAAGYEKSHGRPRHKVQDAEAAVKPPPNEPESLAEGAQVNVMSAGAEAGPRPAVASFREVLQKQLDNIKPKNMEQTLEFKESGKAAQLRGEVTGAVKSQKDTATKPLAQAAGAPLDPTPFKTPTPPDLAPDATDPAQRPLHPEDALPEPKPPGEISLDANKAEAEQLMADNDIDEDQLRRANEPQCTQALEAKQELDAHADKVPETYREHEQVVLATEAKQVAKEGTHALVAMRHKRKGSKGSVRSAQETRQTLEEAERQQVANDIRGKYLAAKSAVETRLTKLDTDVATMFDTAEADARKIFEDHVDKRMSDYKDDRYSGVRGKARWVWDKITDMPDAVNAFYVEGTELYIKAMSDSFDALARKVDDELAQAKTDIDKSKNEITTYIEGLEGNKKTWGTQAFESISGDFSALESSVEDKKQDLANDLARRYRESREKLDQRIEELKEQNRGLLGRFKAFIKRVIEILKKLKDLAVTLLRVGGQILRGLIKDPIGFLGNLFGAIKEGFGLFGQHIETHLKEALISFVTGSVREIGISAAADDSPKGIFGLLLQVLGITVEHLKEKVARLVGARNVERVQQAWNTVSGLLSDGAAGLWDRAKEHLGDVKERVEAELKDWIGTQIVKAGLTWIVSLFSPASALLRAIKMIYDVVTFFFSNIDRIIDLVNGILSAITAIVAGKVDAAAKRVENALAKGLAFLLGFLASLLGLSGIGNKVRGIIARVRQPVDRAIDAVLRVVVRGLKWVVAKGARAFTRAKGAAGRAVKAVRQFLFPSRAFRAGKERHRLFFRGKGPEAHLLIASDTQQLEAFVKELRGRPENKQGDGHAALNEVDRQINLIVQAKKDIVNKPEDANKKIDAALAVIADQLRSVLSRGALATKENPLPLEYPKRASARYPKVYTGPIVGTGGPRIKQEDLAAARHSADKKQVIADALPAKAQEDWQRSRMPIEEYDAHGSRKLPLGGDPIGISPDWQTSAGKKLMLPKKKQSTPGGGRINAALAPYGYSASLEKQDGDHVIEIQLGGEDVNENLWPLDRSENRGAGSTLRSAQFDVPGGGKIWMEQLKARAQKGTEVWLVITKTKSV